MKTLCKWAAKTMHQPPIRVKPLDLTWSEPSQTADGSGVAVRASEVTTRCQNPRHATGLSEEYECYMSLRRWADSLIARRWGEALKIPCIQEMVAAGLLAFRGLVRGVSHTCLHVEWNSCGSWSADLWWTGRCSGQHCAQLTDIESSWQKLNKQIFTFILIKKQNGDTLYILIVLKQHHNKLLLTGRQISL